MKNRLYNIVLITLFLVVGCNKNFEVSSSHEIYNSSSTSTSINSVANNEAEILIKYYYSNGVYIDEYRAKGLVGETYSIKSKEINFMKTDDEIVKFTLSKEGYYQNVIYDYSLETYEKIDNKQKFSSFMVDEKRGLSFTYVISGNDSVSNSIFENNYFKICNHNLVLKRFNKHANFRFSSAIKSNYSTDKSLLTGKENEIFVNISINPDYSIDFYKNGELNYTFVSSMRPNYNDTGIQLYVKNFIEYLYEDIANNGFKVGDGNFTIKDLSIGYSLDKEEVKNFYNKIIHTQIKHVDEFGNEILEMKSVIGNKGTSYSYLAPYIDNFVADKNKIEGIYEKSKVETIRYTFQGEEKISHEMKDANQNVLYRYDTYEWEINEWYPIVQKISGDFIVRVNYHLNGNSSKLYSTNGGDSCWRTNLTIIQDAFTNDLFVARLDWYGWVIDKNHDEINICSNFDNGSSYVDNYDYDIFNIYNDCNITETITRVDDKINIDFIIKPNKVGYNQRVYYHSVKLYGVKTEKLDISFGAEDAIVTFNSIKVLN